MLNSSVKFRPFPDINVLVPAHELPSGSASAFQANSSAILLSSCVYHHVRKSASLSYSLDLSGCGSLFSER